MMHDHSEQLSFTTLWFVFRLPWVNFRYICKSFGQHRRKHRKTSVQLRNTLNQLCKSSLVFGSTLKIFGRLRVNFANLRKTSGQLCKSLEDFVSTSERGVIGTFRECVFNLGFITMILFNYNPVILFRVF